MRNYLEDDMRIEPDFLNRWKNMVEKSWAQVDESIGGDESGGDARFPVEPVILADGVKCQQRQHSVRSRPSISNHHS